jgi:hypothetical protein
MLKKILTTFAVIVTAATMTSAQTKPAAPKTDTKPPMTTQKIAAPPAGKAVNIRVQLAINDQVDPASPGRKVMTMIVADRQVGNVRSVAHVRYGGSWRAIEINVDAHPTLLDGNKIRLDLGLEYQPETGNTGESPSLQGMAQMNQRQSFILESGKPLVVSEAADPTSDRKVTVEVTATILE